MGRDSIEWRESGRSKVDELLQEMHRISLMQAAARFKDPGKCSECGYMIGNLSFPANCIYCGCGLPPGSRVARSCEHAV